MSKSDQIEKEFYLYNVKILPPKDGTYDALLQGIYEANISIIVAPTNHNSRTVKIETIETSDGVVYGTLVSFSNKRFHEVYNEEQKARARILLKDIEHLDPHIASFYFVPEAHRMCITKEIPRNHVITFLRESIEQTLFMQGKEVHIYQETDCKSLEDITSLRNITSFKATVSYTNDDLTKDFEALWDQELKADRSEKAEVKVSASQNNPNGLSIRRGSLIHGLAKLAQSNGSAEVTVLDSEGKKQVYSTESYPRKETISSPSASMHLAVKRRIMDIFRNETDK